MVPVVFCMILLRSVVGWAGLQVWLAGPVVPEISQKQKIFSQYQTLNFLELGCGASRNVFLEIKVGEGKIP